MPVWGWAEPGEKVTVSIAGQTKTATTDAAGKWSVKLDKLSAGEALTLVVTGKNTNTVNDVLVGEVWLGSGQSNMQMWMKGVRDIEQKKAAAKFPQLRMFTVKRNEKTTPQTDCEGAWVICSPETVETFSATAYFFGRDLHQKLGVPVGLIASSVGGTPIEGLTSMEKMEGKKELAPVFNEWAEKMRVPFDPVKAQAQYEKQYAAWKTSSAKRVAEGKPAGYAPQKPVPPREDKNYPANLYNGMIAPIIPYAIRGGIWYQGANSGHEIILSFKHTDGGLMAKDGDLQGFVIAGADKKWHWAKARIEGEQVVASRPEGKSPVAVRYAWADNPRCNLYNGAGLPASPFRTDDW